MPVNNKAEKNLKDGGKRIETLARDIAEPILKEAGYKLWDVVFEKEGAMWYLRVLFDKEDGADGKQSESITDEECEKITVPINAAFDRQKFIENVDILEIGSPGITRRLRLPEHFEKYTGCEIRCAVRGEKGKTENVTGMLENYSEEKSTVFLKPEYGAAAEIEIKKCIRINLV